MNFNDLEIPGSPVVFKTWHNKRFVISADPYDTDTILARAENKNVFLVYDKHNQSVSTKVWTNKVFEDFVKWFLKSESSQIPFFVSHKFINNEGKTCNLGEANPGSEPSKRYNDTF
jgi:hypothetical protein